ncbi:uncharacterized protein BDV17DRAFT_293226 [Aspergillus undulatus]|uniref:uncharacterized protein n=1 Tax=Aspergillus undulatus TaxID=1810928 RepID=UPI003CCE172D
MILQAEEAGETIARKREILNTVPSGLNELFNQVFAGLSASGRVDTLQILKWVLCSKRRLSPIELYFALSLDSISPALALDAWVTSDSYISGQRPIMRLVRSRSRGLLQVMHIRKVYGHISRPVHREIAYFGFIHGTVEQFLIQGGQSILYNGPPNDRLEAWHGHLAESCIAYLDNRELWDYVNSNPKLEKRGAREFRNGDIALDEKKSKIGRGTEDVTERPEILVLG